MDDVVYNKVGFFTRESKIPGFREIKANFEIHRLNANIAHMSLFALFVIALEIYLQVQNILRGSEDFEASGGVVIPVTVYIVMSLATTFFAILYAVLYRLVKKNKIKSFRMKTFLVHSFLYLYVIFTLGFSTCNILTGGGVNSYLIVIVCTAAIPVLKPAQSVTTIGVCYAFTLLTMYYVRGISSTWREFTTSDDINNVTLITGFLIVSSVCVYRLFLNNYINSVELTKTNRALDEMANTDLLTGVYNRRAFYKKFDELWKAAEKNGYKLAVAMVDIDFFKSYNDSFGHLQGDICLCGVAGCLRASFRRSSDIVARFGGEEFIIAFKTNDESARDIANAARRAVEDLKITHARKDVSDFVTISIGVSVFRPTGDLHQDKVIKLADEALYHSKETRNTTSVEYVLGAGDRTSVDAAAKPSEPASQTAVLETVSAT